MRALQSLHEGFARNFGASLSALLRTIVEAKLISVDQLTYSEFVYSLEIPTCFNLLKPMPLEGNWILDISPSLLYPIIDRMLGGVASAESTLKRPLSEIELRLTSRITGAFLRDLTAAWANAVTLVLEVQRVESNPQLVQIVPPNEVVILVSFELTMGKTRGMVNLCIPFNTIERIGSKLTNNSWIGYASSRSSDESQEHLSSMIGESVMEVVVTLARSTLKTRIGSAQPASWRYRQHGKGHQRAFGSGSRGIGQICCQSGGVERQEGDRDTKRGKPSKIAKLIHG